MPQLVPVVLKDNAAADHTFNPASSTAGVSLLIETTGVPLGDKRLTVTSTTTPQGRRKVNLKLVIPVVQDSLVNGISRPTVVRTAYASVDFSFDPGSGINERKDLRLFVDSLMKDPTISATIDSLVSLY